MDALCSLPDRAISTLLLMRGRAVSVCQMGNYLAALSPLPVSAVSSGLPVIPLALLRAFLEPATETPNSYPGGLADSKMSCTRRVGSPSSAHWFNELGPISAIFKACRRMAAR